tara:strand:+ start:564 stop:860 length:297 start_codon:yes stop_codon:yes gene_type:complete
MLIQLQKLNIINEGYGKTSVSVEDIYINPTCIVSVKNYQGIKSFLIKEEITYPSTEEDFSLIKLSVGPTVEEIIVSGSSEEIYAKLQNKSGKREVLNG